MAKSTSVAELFYVPGDDEIPDAEDLAELDTLNTLLVRIDTETPGIPVEIDGHIIGDAPTVAEVKPGWHTVILHNGDVTSNFRLEASSDPDSWCFEARGRGFKDVRCPQ
jgi:hypothetical protein